MPLTYKEIHACGWDIELTENIYRYKLHVMLYPSKFYQSKYGLDRAIIFKDMQQVCVVELNSRDDLYKVMRSLYPPTIKL